MWQHALRIAHSTVVPLPLRFGTLGETGACGGGGGGGGAGPATVVSTVARDNGAAAADAAGAPGPWTSAGKDADAAMRTEPPGGGSVANRSESPPNVGWDPADADSLSPCASAAASASPVASAAVASATADAAGAAGALASAQQCVLDQAPAAASAASAASAAAAAAAAAAALVTPETRTKPGELRKRCVSSVVGIVDRLIDGRRFDTACAALRRTLDIDPTANKASFGDMEGGAVPLYLRLAQVQCKARRGVCGVVCEGWCV
jgi:hypothetical protein